MTAATAAPPAGRARPRPIVEDWLYRAVPQPAAARPVVCFPHAGGDVTAFTELAVALAPELEVWAVRLPGRGGRFRDPMPTQFDALVSAVAAGISPRLRPGTVFYGQSFGALLAYEVARTLPPALRPALLVAACAPAPDRWLGTVADPDAAALDLWRGCGLGERLPEDSGLLEPALRVLRADLAVCHGYRHRPGPRFDVPVHAVAATEDPAVDQAQAAGWAGVTGGPFAASVVQGGHLLATPLTAGPADLLRSLAMGRRGPEHPE